MNDELSLPIHLRALFDAVCDEMATQEQLAELEVVLQDEETQQRYWEYCSLHVDLHFAVRQQQRQDLVREAIRTEALPRPELTTTPIPNLLGGATHGMMGYFASGWPVAYLAAAVIVVIGVLIGSQMPVSQPGPIATDTSPRPQGASPSDMQFVGRITDMQDCYWTDPTAAVTGFVPVPLGRRYELASGLMEITYDTGARVILEGPCTYEVDSLAGGFLSVGKLTARVEKNGDRNESQRALTLALSQGERGPDSEVRATDRSQLSTLNSRLFAVRTPTAVVTDLGTEFGVEVNENGRTTSHVFRGSVVVQAVGADEGAGDQKRILRKNDTVSVERATGKNAVVLATSDERPSFVRQMPKQAIGTLDLVDVIAGGDGFSKNRGRGIHPITGQIANAPVELQRFELQGDYQYHRVGGIPFVDGVFVPDGSKGTVQIDSAGHVFPDCPTTDNRTWLNFWAGGKLPEEVAARMSPTLAGVDYFSPEHTALFMHSNKGITFDLDAIRQANRECKLLRFRAVAGNMEPNSEDGDNVSADIWVLVDGQVRFKRREVNHFMGPMPINIPLGANDRFLTLSVTDGGNSYSCDLVIFGDPRLELARPKTMVNDTK